MFLCFVLSSVVVILINLQVQSFTVNHDVHNDIHAFNLRHTRPTAKQGGEYATYHSKFVNKKGLILLLPAAVVLVISGTCLLSKSASQHEYHPDSRGKP